MAGYSVANSAGNVSTSNACGTVDWTNPAYIKNSDNNYANASSAITAARTYCLKANSFGFNIANNYKIAGIKVAIDKKAGSTTGGYVFDSSIRLIKSGNNAVGDTINKAYAGNWNETEETTIYGGSDDLWDETWDVSDINDAKFGVSISSLLRPGLSAGIAYIDYVEITIYYDSKNATELITLGNPGNAAQYYPEMDTIGMSSGNVVDPDKPRLLLKTT
jgi:hypothetical protein